MIRTERKIVPYYFWFNVCFKILCVCVCRRVENFQQSKVHPPKSKSGAVVVSEWSSMRDTEPVNHKGIIWELEPLWLSGK